MKLLTKALIRRFEKIGRQEDVKDPIVVAKFFNPGGAGTWYATEYDPATRCFFGYVSIFGDINDEWGYFSLDELESATCPFYLVGEGHRYKLYAKIERDLYFPEQPISQVEPKAVHKTISNL
jgi:hypothetical protein